MHLEILVEEPSAKEVLDRLVPKIVGQAHSFEVHAFRNKDDLLEKVGARLRAYGKWVPRSWRFVVLVDEDRQDCHELKARIEQAAGDARLETRTLARVAIEELEAWFFGDIAALRSVYPRLPASLGQKERYRDPDAIKGGTWEALDCELRRCGYPEGLRKVATARRVAEQMDPRRNRSHSFRVFRDGLAALVAA